MSVFVKGGPDIPEDLVRAHEDGKVVFFCGAGISVPAGLPTFRGLVDKVYGELEIDKDSLEDDAYQKEQYDITLNLLERRYPRGRIAVRSAVSKILQPKWRNEGATDTHQALLDLSTTPQGMTRLVTTNFDRIFQRVIKKNNLKVSASAAPLLPVPKPSRWNSVVYLHGLLPSKGMNKADLNNLVLSSGDFGLAYLNERWASRFVSELFRNYVVCFVGYEINDPVLRYMTDSFAADEMLGEKRRDTYAFAGFTSEGRKNRKEWEAKGVIPIPYRDHAKLHLSLKEWANRYRDGIDGKKMTIYQYARSRPLSPSQSDIAVGLVRWAIADESAAEYFANMNPVAPWEWLEPLESFFQDKNVDSQKVRSHLVRWLTRYLNEPQPILWLVKQNGELQDIFRGEVKERLRYLEQFENEGRQDEIERIQENAPQAIPDSFMRALWDLFLLDRLNSNVHELGIYEWLSHFRQHGITPVLRMKLCNLLTPRVAIEEPYLWEEERNQPSSERKPERFVRRDIVLYGDYVRHALHEQEGDQDFESDWGQALPILLQDFTLLLRDALDLKKELGDADSMNDKSFLIHRSIEEHPQSDRHGISGEWTLLIDLNRDAWLAMNQTNPAEAKRIAEGWLITPYPLFKRLAFFAAKYNDLITPQEGIRWLLADSHWWLWSVETQREAIRLLMYLAPLLDTKALEKLEKAIVEGPPSSIFKVDMNEVGESIDREVWLRLMKMKGADAKLGKLAQTKLSELEKQYPRWGLAEDDRDEFPFWSEVKVQHISEIPLKPTPRRRRELMQWLRGDPQIDYRKRDDWRERCQNDFPTAAVALCALAQKDEWPHRGWSQALNAWIQDQTDGKLLKRSWRYMAPVISGIPDKVAQELSRDIGLWIGEVAETLEGSDSTFFSLARRILDLQRQDQDAEAVRNEVIPAIQRFSLSGKGPSHDLISRAINRPVGLVTKALLNWWFRQPPRSEKEWREKIKPIFTSLCKETQIENFRGGRLLLAAYALPLFQVDEEWTKEKLLPLFDWQKSEVEAQYAWQGFLWAPRIHFPLLSAIKPHFLETAKHFNELGEHADQFIDFLTFVALDSGGIFTTEELLEATSNLPREKGHVPLWTLMRTLDGAGERRKEYWINRVRPYLLSIWHEVYKEKTSEMCLALAKLLIKTGDAFPDAVKEFHPWLQKIDESGRVTLSLRNTDFCKKFPSESLMLLDAVVEDTASSLPEELKKRLDDIENSDERLAHNRGFKRLKNICERRKDG